jgi:hypothetical protein
MFSGIDGAEQAGLLLFNPPTVGSSLPDFWRKNADNSWSTFTIDAGATPANFNARVTAVPEPGTYALGLLGLMSVAAFRRFRR